MSALGALVLAVFLASVLGSLHCAGMCGAFLAFAVGGLPGEKGGDADGGDGASTTRLQVAYHLGRLTTYTLLGAAAGGVGALLDLTASLAGLQRVAAATAGGLMVVFGVVTLLRLRGVAVGRLKLPGAWTRAVSRGHGYAMKLGPTRRALTIGLLTTLLPCGWLYAFAVTAAGTASVATGALVMAVFWVGTLPVLVSLGAGLSGAMGVLGKRMPAVTCVAVIAVGLWMVVGRAGLDPAALAAAVEARAAEAQAAGLLVPDASETPACCLPEDGDNDGGGEAESGGAVGDTD